MGRFYTNVDDAALASAAVAVLPALLRAYRSATVLIEDMNQDGAWQNWKDACVAVERAL